MFQKVFNILGGDPHKREVQKLSQVVVRINDLEESYKELSAEALRNKTAEFRQRLAGDETLDDLLPEAFAAVREASKRTIGLRHYDVQMIGGIVLHQGKIAEMRTGEGKTLVATLPLYLNALMGRGVHLITVNDYLARRDARWMYPIYAALGMRVGVLQMATRTENGRNAFLIDPERVSPHEDQHMLAMVPRGEAYQADITYGTNSEFGFDYLRDNLTMSLNDRVQRGHYYAIVDEVDNVLIDEARTPLIISGPAQDEAENYVQMAQVVRQLNPEDYEINERDRAVSLTEIGETHVEEIMGVALRDPDRPEDITPEQVRLLGYLEQGLRAQFLYKRNKDYLVQAGKVVIVDEFTGRLMPGRRWSEGLHQAVEAKEGVKVEAENVTYATITLQNYFRMYDKLSGMTGTALTEAEEFHKIYKLEVLAIPMNLEYSAMQTNSELLPQDSRDEQGYRYTYYTRREDPLKAPVFWKRKDYPDVVYRSEEAKLRAITEEVIRYYILGRPQLVGTTSVEHSERLSERLSAEPVRRLAQVLLIRAAWLEKNNLEMVEKAEPELQPLNRPLDELGVGDLRQMARGLGLSMNPEDPENIQRLIKVFNLGESDIPRLIKVLQAGIPHEVLNARRHAEESQIIAGAGAFGAVTIATNMAGRGVDIKLGGELSEDILRDVNRVLGRVNDDPFNMTNEERRQALKDIPAEEYGIYEESVTAFLQYMDDMERVRELGGLHVIGSERHEARRIDNQLRGRAARQGDPGSSRFYLSLEDDLMRLFGGQQVENLWKRIFFDESQPLEINLLGRIVEQSQERVEGANFDVRKHLLEYDDVLNTQRQRIYSQRDRVFTKEDLSEDVLDMLDTELQHRIPEGLQDEEGPWKLLAYLDEIQPSLEYEDITYPSFTYRLLIDEIRRKLPSGELSESALRDTLLSLTGRALQLEKEHILHSVQTLLERTEESLEHQLEERFDALDALMDGLSDRFEEGQAPRAQDLITEVSELMRIQVKLSNEQVRQLMEGDRSVENAIRQQVELVVTTINLNRVVGAIERRLEESLGLRAGQFQELNWGLISSQLVDLVEKFLDQRIARLSGADGQVARDLDLALSRQAGGVLSDRQLIQFLILMSQGTRLAFDPRTHRKASTRYVRVRFVYLAAQLIRESSPGEITERVLEHLQQGLEVLYTIRGRFEWNRLLRSEVVLSQLDERVRSVLAEELGVERFEELADLPLGEAPAEERAVVENILGRRMQNEVYRELLLRVISDQWVDYLTKVEALRVSIGLEAYAQRDPLVQYKSQATDMFQTLLADIRMGVISRLFTYQARRSASASLDRERTEGEAEAPAESLPDATASAPAGQPAVPVQEKSSKKKRRRH
ncbi:MAG: hypothetical protein GYA17_21065 [Chloroflexi bacterium]|nr:hypothetical protein [Anaerolineaceae bacterium]NMB90860.1 hypothetical protein [Chloroflexota bacterium]